MLLPLKTHICFKHEVDYKGRDIGRGVVFKTVCDMDVASEPPWRGLRRVSKVLSGSSDRIIGTQWPKQVPFIAGLI
jgi:hypothetical protein